MGPETPTHHPPPEDWAPSLWDNPMDLGADRRLTALTEIVSPEISETDRQNLISAESTTRTFIAERTAFVEAELDGLR